MRENQIFWERGFSATLVANATYQRAPNHLFRRHRYQYYWTECPHPRPAAFILDQIRRNQIDPEQKGPENLNWIAMPGTA